MSNTVRVASLTVRALVDELASTLDRADVAEPRRSASDIVAALLEVPRSWPLLNSETQLGPGDFVRAREAARLLTIGAPFAYAVGCVSFRHLQLTVDERVLIPRPETEVLVGEVLERMHQRFTADETWGTAIDVGTGSGAIALSLACEGRFDRVIASDVSLDALIVARENAARCDRALRAAVEFRHGSFLSPVSGLKASVVVANPPYVAFGEIDALPPGVRDWEPPLALLSGHDGMAATTSIVREASAILEHGGLLALEVDERRASIVSETIMQHGGYTEVGVRLDLAGRERFVVATRS